MAKEQKTFIAGRMNKSVDERLLPEGEYVDGQNIRLGSTELADIGAVENTKGNVALTALEYSGSALSAGAVCIGALDDSAEETMYWFVHDPVNTVTGGVVDMIVSFDTKTQQLTYHVITTVLLNFNPTYLMNEVDKIDDLLFFTDDYNAPRKINVTRGYAQPNGSHVDQIIELDISVIKPQPMNSPVITLESNQANDNFMEDTFLCFAYRYKYKDGEYSATSQFSTPSFMPSDFAVERRNYMNAGMQNAINNATVTFNTGIVNVVGIDILFKEADSSTIWVAKKLDKVVLGYQDDESRSLSFSNGDIYTILSEGEILRLYDNVPRFAKAQTIMGNRIMYGNYLEGRDLIDKDGVQENIGYIAEPVNTAVNAVQKREDRSCGVCLFNVNYNFPFGGSEPRDNQMLVSLSDIPIADLIDGAQLSVSMEYRNTNVFTVPSSVNTSMASNYYPYPATADYVPPSIQPTTSITWSYVVQGNHTSYESAFSGSSWEDQVGTSGTYEEAQSNWSSGYTLTDNYNASQTVPAPRADPNVAIGFLEPIRSARINDDLLVRSGTDAFDLWVEGDYIKVTPNGFQYKIGSTDDNYAGEDRVYMIPELASVRITFEKVGSQKSLHSARDYQVGIVYQDAEGRQTTALESVNNSFHVSAYNSEDLNTAKITIPTTMHPPSWAEKYKFVMKQTETDYETIMCTTFFEEENSGKAWILVNGENANKVKEGMDLRVKMDSAGAPDVLVITTVLDVQYFEEDHFFPVQTPPVAGFSPAGTYFKVLPDNFTLDYDAVGTVLTNGKKTKKTKLKDAHGFPKVLEYPVWYVDPDDGNTKPWPVPAGSLVTFNIHLHRRQYDNMGDDYCGRETCNFEFTRAATADYDSLYEFWLGEGINISQDSNCGPWPFGDDSGPNEQSFATNLFDYSDPNNLATEPENQVWWDWARVVHPTADSILGWCGDDAIITMLNALCDTNSYQFTENKDNAGEMHFEIRSGTHQCGSAAKRLRKESKIECEITVLSTAAQIVFETVPTETIGEVYYENEESFDIVNGFHISGSTLDDTNQTAVVEGIVNLGFFNCFSFFNGVESYKIEDSLIGKKFYLGNRVTAVSEQDYKEIRRGSSITYSGVYNSQNNVNKLNEFNLGLANYKDCEESYGPIQVLHGRRTDILTLQEDRISYVGVSENPESFCHYGRDVYFTDAKRASVIQLKGGDGADALNVISNVGMRSWFRDLFQTSFNRQKLGGYDPYMNEYVLSPTTTRLPFEVPVYGCGGNEMQFTGLLEAQTFIIDFGNAYGNVTVSGSCTHSSTITATYNGVVHTHAPTPVTGVFSFTFDKDVPSVTQATITITPVVSSTSSVTIINPIECPTADLIRIIPVVLTSDDIAGQTRHQEFLYSQGTYFSPLQSQQDEFINVSQQPYVSATLVSRFGPTYAGYQGTGSIAPDGATVYVNSRKIEPTDTFNYNTATNRMRHLRVSGVLGSPPYDNTAVGIAGLLAASAGNILSNGGVEPLIGGNFPMPAGADEDYLYLIWDYREVNKLQLCYSTTTPTVAEACCECFSAPDCVPFLGFHSSVDSATACLGTPVSTFYTSVITTAGVSNTIPIIGTTVYPSTGCDSDPNRRFLQAGFIHFNDEGTDKWVQIDSNNIVIASGNC